MNCRVFSISGGLTPFVESRPETLRVGVSIIALSLCLVACNATVPPEPEVDSPVAIPDSWNSGNDSAVMPWSEDVGDPGLRNLITQALTQNFDLRIGEIKAIFQQADLY